MPAHSGGDPGGPLADGDPLTGGDPLWAQPEGSWASSVWTPRAKAWAGAEGADAAWPDQSDAIWPDQSDADWPDESDADWQDESDAAWADPGEPWQPSGPPLRFRSAAQLVDAGYNGRIYPPDHDADQPVIPLQLRAEPVESLPPETPFVPDISRDPADQGVAWALACYLSAAVGALPIPVGVLLLRARHSRVLRSHAAQAANAAITLLLYFVCAVIAGGLLALGSVPTGERVAAISALLIWALTVVYLGRAAWAARNSSFYRIPDWLCATLLRPRDDDQEP